MTIKLKLEGAHVGNYAGGSEKTTLKEIKEFVKDTVFDEIEYVVDDAEKYEADMANIVQEVDSARVAYFETDEGKAEIEWAKAQKDELNEKRKEFMSKRQNSKK